MVVVAMIGILAALAVPSFVEGRNDRTAFDYARQYQQLLVQGRSRAAGTGAAHLALLGPGAGTKKRGQILLFQALDGQPAPPLNIVGPNPVASCKLNPTQWNQALQVPPVAPSPVGATNNVARLVDGVDVNRPGVTDDMDLKAELKRGDGTLNATMATVDYLAVCITPAGITYVGSGDSAANAIANMRTAGPFTGVAEVSFSRHKGGTPVGLRRRVMITGGGAPRLRSE
jgi:type II secretory pathway pseudopilin PulG